MMLMLNTIFSTNNVIINVSLINIYMHFKPSVTASQWYSNRILWKPFFPQRTFRDAASSFTL